MIDNNFLMDDWTRTGSGMVSLKEAVEDLAGHTEVIKAVPGFVEKNDGVYLPERYDPETKKVTMLVVRDDFNPKRLALNGFPDTPVVYEMLETSGIFLRNDDNNYLVSEKAFPSLSKRTGIGHDAMASLSLERNHFLYKLLKDGNKVCSLVVRHAEVEGKNLKKVFAVHSERYSPIDQNVVISLIERIEEKYHDTMGHCVTSQWSVSHELTQVLLTFPEKEKELKDAYDTMLTPAIRIVTSDTGESAFCLQAIWLLSGSGIIVQEEAKVVHVRKTENMEDILFQKIEDVIFPAFTELPERLLELMDLTLISTGTIHGRARMEDIFDFVFRTSQIVTSQAISKEASAALKEELMAEFDLSSEITAYDVARVFIDLPGRLKGDIQKWRMDRLERCCGKVPFLNFEALAKTETLYLTA